MCTVAEKVCIQYVPEGPGSEYAETIEARIEDSKTGFARWTVFLGETHKTKIQAASHLREWWAMNGFLGCGPKKVGSFVEERPNYWVVRVSLLDMSQKVFKGFFQEIEWTESPVLIKDRAATMKYAAERKDAKTIGDEMKYVNVTGGALEGYEIAEATSWLTAKGFGRFTTVVEGPLFRATLGHKLTHMPYSPNSTHVHLIPAMRLAFKEARAANEPDPEYDQTTDPKPKFANHSNRRHADRVAMRNAKETGVSDIDINFFFGWELKKMSQNMRLHYAGLDRVLRLGLSWVTAKM